MEFRMIDTGEVSLRCAIEGSGPLAIMVHGFPESWYSWRHQIGPVAQAGFSACAIDVRGYGGSVPSKTAHNTALEVAWTGIPILILVGIAVPSVALINKQYTPAPEKALTIKATGNQWYWTYKYPDNGDIEVISNMLPHDKAIANGEPSQLAVDNRMVVPVGEPIRFQTTGADVIHSFAIPSLWFKIDAVPGKLNERQLIINEPGVYYGQCSELCGARHGYMPIAIEALPRDEFNRWVLEQGGKIDGMPDAPAAAAAPAPAAKPAA